MELSKTMHEAMFYQKLKNNVVQCDLCPNYCTISDGECGSCRSRKNISGVLFASNYARTVSINIDPIEKKPLYHYYPGSKILSLGANSCNLHCDFCQNYEISQFESPTSIVYPDELLDTILRQNLKQVAFTYTEPITWYEYITDCAKLFKEHNIKIVMVTNGYINQSPLKQILPLVDAFNIDLKSFNDNFYNEICKGKLAPVIETVIEAAKSCHLEITNLLIPELNDNLDDITSIVDFICNINPNIPLHFSRYFPRWLSHHQVTPDATLIDAYKIASKKLRYVYLGNSNLYKYSQTICPICYALLISRENYHVDNHMNYNQCFKCGNTILGCFK